MGQTSIFSLGGEGGYWRALRERLKGGKDLGVVQAHAGRGGLHNMPRFGADGLPRMSIYSVNRGAKSGGNPCPGAGLRANQMARLTENDP